MAIVNFTIIVRDANTHATLPGAQIFINGVGKGSSDPNGQFTLTLVGNASITVAIKLNNYDTFTSTFQVTSNSFTANLIFNQPANIASFVLFVLPEDKASGSAITFSNGGSPVTVAYSPGGTTVPNLTVGSQTITASITGFQPINTTIDMAVTKSKTIQMSVLSDSGIKTTQIQQPVQDPDNSGLLPALSPEDLQEYIAPNTNQGTYFTMTQARVYIGDLFINELNSLQWALQDNKIPIYGYASRFLDAKAQGKSLVQGQFSINFISEGYLVAALRHYQEMIDQGTLTTDPIADDNQRRLSQLVNKLQNPDPRWTPDQIQQAKTEINNLAASMGPDAIASASAGIGASRRKQNDNILGLPGGDFANAVYEDVEFDIIIQYTGAGRTITRRLEKCSLIANETIMDLSGTPILDSYGFIARRVR